MSWRTAIPQGTRRPIGLPAAGTPEFEPPDAAIGTPSANRLFLNRLQERLHLGDVPAQELLSLAGEKNTNFFFEQLLSFGHRLRSAGNFAEAVQLYQEVLASLQGRGPAMHPLRWKAAQELDAMLGRGPVGPRADFLFPRFTSELADPWLWAAFGTGNLIYEGSKCFALARLFQSPVPGLLTRSLGAELVAAGVGLAAETSTVVGISKLGRELSGTPQTGGFESGWAELAATSLTLFCLRSASRFGKVVFGRQALRADLAAPAGLGWRAARFGIELAPQAFLYGGILAAQELQSVLGLRHKLAGETAAFDGLMTLLHVQVGSHIFASLAGANVRNALRSLEWRSRQLRVESQAARPGDPPTPAPEVRKFSDRPPVDRGERRLSTHLWMEGGPEEGGGKAAALWTSEEVLAAAKFLYRLSPAATEALMGVYSTEMGQLRLMRTLRQHTLKDEKFLELALCRLGYALKQSRGSRGTYLDWLLKSVFEEVVEQNDGARADRILHFLSEGGSVLKFEAMLARDLPHLNFNRYAGWLPERWKSRYPFYGRIQNMPLPQDLKNILFRWAFAQSQAGPASPYFQEEGHLLQAISAHQWNRMGPIRGVLENAARSPLGILRLKRLYQVLTDPEGIEDFTDLKLHELADPHLTIVGEKSGRLPHSRFLSSPSQFNAYLGREAPEALIHEIQRRLPDLLNPQRAAARRERREAKLAQLENVRGRVAPMSAPSLSAAFKLLGDPYSIRIAREVQKEKFELQVLSNDDFETQSRLLAENQDPERDNAAYFPPGPGRPKGVMLVRRTPLDLYSSSTAPDVFFEVLAKVAHEFQHFTDIVPGMRHTPGTHLRIEMPAHLRDALWRAEHGDVRKLERYARDGASGFALHFLNEFEKLYGPVFRKGDEIG